MELFGKHDKSGSHEELHPGYSAGKSFQQRMNRGTIHIDNQPLSSIIHTCAFNTD